MRGECCQHGELSLGKIASRFAAVFASSRSVIRSPHLAETHL
jgi:hypothetical protein